MALRQMDVLVRIRKLQENLQAQVLAETRRKINVAHEQRNQVLEQRQVILGEAGRRANDGFDAREVRVCYQYERYLKKTADAMDADIDRLKKVGETQRRELEQAMQRRKMVEKLSGHMRRDLDAATRKEEQKRLDESATNAAARRELPEGRQRDL